jgi:Domain of unknown function (DUF4382)
MRSARCSLRSISASPKLIFALLLLSMSLAGCGDSCFMFVSNPGGGTIAGGTNMCPVNSMNGNVRLRMTSAATAASNSGTNRIQHIFVTLRGVEATTNALASDESLDWRELAPNLAMQPVQVDLLERSGDSCESNRFESVAVPANTYRQMRLRLAANQPDASEPMPQENACGSVGLNCVVTSDHGIEPLVLESKLSQIQVSPDRISGGFIEILPEATVDLKIEFNPQLSLFVPAGETMSVVPIFTVESQASCQSVASIDR